MSFRCLAAVLIPLALAGARAPAHEPMTAGQVIATAEAHHEKLADYDCLVDTEARLGEKSESAQLHLWYKKPGMLRARVLRGKEKGSEVLVREDGEIRARKGGLLKAFVLHLKPDDERLRNIRGARLMDLEWGAFYREYHERAARHGASVTLAAHPEAASPYEVAVTYPDGAHHVREVYRIDPQLWSIAEGEIYEDGVRVSRATFSECKVDTGLKDDLFDF